MSQRINIMKINAKEFASKLGSFLKKDNFVGNWSGIAPLSPYSREGNRYGPYTIIEKIGQGQFATVHRAFDSRRKQHVAMKVVLKYRLDITAMHNLGMEIETLKGCSHQNVMKLIEAWEDEAAVFFILEYAQDGDLFSMLEKNDMHFNEETARHYFAQLLAGVNYLHRRDVAHRDLKIDNLLVTDNNRLIIGDFGFAKKMENDGKVRGVCGTPFYNAPEVMTGKSYRGRPADVWSCGMILFAMFAGFLPWDDFRANNSSKYLKGLYNYIRNTPLEFPETVPSEARELISKMLEKDPRKRATIDEIIQHPWMSTIQPSVFLNEKPIVDDNSVDVELIVVDEKDHDEPSLIEEPPDLKVMSVDQSTYGEPSLDDASAAFNVKVESETTCHQYSVEGSPTVAEDMHDITSSMSGSFVSEAMISSIPDEKLDQSTRYSIPVDSALGSMSSHDLSSDCTPAPVAKRSERKVSRFFKTIKKAICGTVKAFQQSMFIVNTYLFANPL